MSRQDLEREFLQELQRVLHDEGTVSADFFAALGPIGDPQLDALTRWMRTQPTGLGETGLVRALTDWLGPHLPS